MRSIWPRVFLWSSLQSPFPSWLAVRVAAIRLSLRVTATTSTVLLLQSISCWDAYSPLEDMMTLRIDWRSSWPWRPPVCWGWVKREHVKISGTERVCTSCFIRSYKCLHSCQWIYSNPVSRILCFETPITQFTGLFIHTRWWLNSFKFSSEIFLAFVYIYTSFVM